MRVSYGEWCGKSLRIENKRMQTRRRLCAKLKEQQQNHTQIHTHIYRVEQVYWQLPKCDKLFQHFYPVAPKATGFRYHLLLFLCSGASYFIFWSMMKSGNGRFYISSRQNPQRWKNSRVRCVWSQIKFEILENVNVIVAPLSVHTWASKSASYEYFLCSSVGGRTR